MVAPLKLQFTVCVLVIWMDIFIVRSATAGLGMSHLERDLHLTALSDVSIKCIRSFRRRSAHTEPWRSLALHFSVCCVCSCWLSPWSQTDPGRVVLTVLTAAVLTLSAQSNLTSPGALFPPVPSRAAPLTSLNLHPDARADWHSCVYWARQIQHRIRVCSAQPVPWMRLNKALKLNSE